MAPIRFDLDYERLRREVDYADEGILDGSAIAGGVETQVAEAVATLRERGVTPKLAVVRVGDDPASAVYVRQKMKSCAKLDIASDDIELPGEISAGELHERLQGLSEDASIHGTLLQVPLPEHLDSLEFLESVDPTKDVDGFHPRNLGCLMAGQSDLEACTPRGVMTMLKTAGVEIAGKDAVVVGRSRIVGRPMAQMLLRDDATVTVCHRHTADLEAKVAGADIVVVATGVPHLIDGEWIQPGATVIDVGITRRDDGTLVGDVEFDVARERAALITPVPGGVGPMTVATLMQNTVVAACLQHGLTFEGDALREID